jgi:hypothetical protein
MQKPLFLKKIILVLGFALVVFGCASNKTSPLHTDITIKAESVSEGISLSFNYIPRETARMFIYIYNTENINTSYDVIPAFSDIRGASLENLKQIKRVNFPFVQADSTYKIEVLMQNDKFEEIADWISVECKAANNGINYSGGELLLIENQTGVILISEPVFQTDVWFALDKYNFQVSICLDENRSVGYGGDYNDSFIWIFEPFMSEGFKESDWGQYDMPEDGIYSAFVSLFCNIIYDNILWQVEMGKSPEFLYTFPL